MASYLEGRVGILGRGGGMSVYHGFKIENKTMIIKRQKGFFMAECLLVHLKNITIDEDSVT